MASSSKVKEVVLSKQELFDQAYQALLEEYGVKVYIEGLQVVYKMIKNQDGQPVMVDAEIGGQAVIKHVVQEETSDQSPV